MKHISVALAAVGLATTVISLQTAGASSPGTSALTVPKAGPKTVAASWTGTVSAAQLSTTFSDCEGNLGTVDAHTIHVTVAPGAYSVVKAKLTLTVDSSPTLSADFIELKDPSGAVAGTDQQHPEMSVEVSNPIPGNWTALVCSAFTDSAPSHDYTAEATVTTKCKGVSPCPAPLKKRR